MDLYKYCTTIIVLFPDSREKKGLVTNEKFSQLYDVVVQNV